MRLSCSQTLMETCYAGETPSSFTVHKGIHYACPTNAPVPPTPLPTPVCGCPGPTTSCTASVAAVVGRGTVLPKDCRS
eukprot:gene10777-biopygen16818